jgi:ribosomal protein S18 acetylase RimI-like enzyme
MGEKKQRSPFAAPPHARGLQVLMRVEFRPAIASDVDALAALERENFESDRIPRSSFRRLVSRPSATIVVAQSGKQLAGYCLTLFRQGSAVARLYSIAVSREFAGAGLGRALLVEAEDAAARRGCRELRLEVRLDNERARLLYEKAGYALFGKRDSYYSDGLAALRFRKALAPRPGQPGRNRPTELGTAR